MIKVTGGYLRGRYINSIDGAVTRPTSSKVREALFNIISDSIEESVFLDLFAGTGLVGIEAISRGAQKIVSVEKDLNAFKILKKNLLTLDIESKFEVFKTDAEIFLKKTNETFDYIYIDPPYRSDCYEKVFKLISDKPELISPDGKIIVEYGTKIPLPSFSMNLHKSYRYGDTSINIYTK